MRIIAGKLGGRQFDSPKGHRTHPMSDKIRGALFNMLGDVDGLTVLDAFSGSGALSLEAISRGAAAAVAIDNDRTAHRVIKANAELLGIHGQLKTVHAGAASWSANNPDKRFDLVLVAPPYDYLQLPLLQKLVRHVKPQGLYVLDWPGNLAPPEFVDLNQIANKHYGDAQLVIYRKTS